MKKTVAMLLACFMIFAAMPALAENDNRLSFTDSANREIEVPADIERVAVSGTMAQMVLFPLAADRLVGLGNSFSDTATGIIDEKYIDMPLLGNVYKLGDTFNMEQCLLVDPQIIIDTGEPKDTIVEDMDSISEQLNIPTAFIETTLATMGDAYRKIGTLLNCQDDAEVLAQYCDDVYSATMRGLEKVEKKKIIYLSGDDGLSTIAKGTYQAELLDIMGDNAAEVEDAVMYSSTAITMEQLLLWDPDVILFAPGSVYENAADDAAWQQLTAIQNGTYYEVPTEVYCWIGLPPTVNEFMGMIWLSELLYPDNFDYDMHAEVAKFYKTFCLADLTDAQIDAILANAQ